MRAGFARGIEAFGLEARLVEGVTIEDSLDDMQAAMASVFAGPRRPDGVVCGAGSSAIAIVAAAESVGLVLGRDIHLAAKQSSRVLQRFRPSIHSIDEDFREAGRDLASFVLRAINGESPDQLQRLAYAQSAER
jgi:LacI family transcriptional regulator